MCTNCDIARDRPDYRLYNPTCLWCGVRILQRAADWPLPESVVKERRRENVAIWVGYGHSELELRRLFKGPPAYAPIGPAESTEFVNPTPKKRR